MRSDINNGIVAGLLGGIVFGIMMQMMNAPTPEGGQMPRKEETMNIERVLALALALFLFCTPAFAQLGPKDGGNLAPTDLDRVRIGQPAPDFTLENLDGRRISLSDFRGKKNVVLVFYRGHW